VQLLSRKQLVGDAHSPSPPSPFPYPFAALLPFPSLPPPPLPSDPLLLPSLVLPSPPVSDLPLRLEVGPLNGARGSGERCELPAGSGAEPQPKSNLVHFSFKI